MSYVVNPVVHIHKEPFGLVVYISQDHLAIAEKLDFIWLVVKFLQNQFRHLYCQHRATQLKARDGWFWLGSSKPTLHCPSEEMALR